MRSKVSLNSSRKFIKNFVGDFKIKFYLILARSRGSARKFPGPSAAAAATERESVEGCPSGSRSFREIKRSAPPPRAGCGSATWRGGIGRVPTVCVIASSRMLDEARPGRRHVCDEACGAQAQASVLLFFFFLRGGLLS